MTDPARRLTDDDVQAIVDAAEARIISNFYGNIGRGLWGLVWKAILVGAIALAAYGALGKGH